MQHCIAWARLKPKQNSGSLTAEEKTKWAELEDHRHTWFSQGSSKKQLRQNLDVGDVIVTHDFTSIALEPQGHDLVTLKVLVMALEFIEYDEEKKTISDLRIKYYNFLCDDPASTNDFHFVRQAWDHAMTNGFFDDFDTIHLWSDGATKHFKQCYAISYFSTINETYGKEIAYNFFASYHGHSLADGHAASFKSKLRKAAKEEGGRREKLVQDLTAGKESSDAELKMTIGPTNAREAADVIQKSIGNARCVAFDKINKDPSLKPDVSRIPHIKSYHRFEFLGSYIVRCKKRTSDENGNIVSTQSSPQRWCICGLGPDDSDYETLLLQMVECSCGLGDLCYGHGWFHYRCVRDQFDPATNTEETTFVHAACAKRKTLPPPQPTAAQKGAAASKQKTAEKRARSQKRSEAKRAKRV